MSRHPCYCGPVQGFIQSRGLRKNPGFQGGSRVFKEFQGVSRGFQGFSSSRIFQGFSVFKGSRAPGFFQVFSVFQVFWCTRVFQECSRVFCCSRFPRSHRSPLRPWAGPCLSRSLGVKVPMAGPRYTLQPLDGKPWFFQGFFSRVFQGFFQGFIFKGFFKGSSV